MKTVKEISKQTGISVRTLHYYDEIGLLIPTEKSEAGYRLYDDKALEILQQILFFREFDIPLKEIKAVMNNPALDRNDILQMQRNMLVTKKDRMERLIASIDELLKGGNDMDFEVFSKAELEELCQNTIDHMPEFMRDSIIKEFGGLEQWKKHYIERSSKEDMQKGYQKLVEAYDSKESAWQAMINPPAKEAVAACEERLDTISKQLIECKNVPLNSDAVKSAVEQYGYEMKQLYRMKDEKMLMLSIASSYRDERVRAANDEKYGEGAAEFFARAFEEYYNL